MSQKCVVQANTELSYYLFIFLYISSWVDLNRMLSSRQSLYMMEKLHFFIKSIKKDVVQKRDKSSTVQNVFCTTMHFRNELLLEIEHMIWAPQLPSNKSKKTSNFLQLFCWKLYRNFFSFFERAICCWNWKFAENIKRK